MIFGKISEWILYQDEDLEKKSLVIREELC